MRITRLMLTAGALAAAVFAGCDGESETPKTQPPASVTPAASTDTYNVRGVIAQLPIEGQPSAQLMIHHEAIPTFRRRSGDMGMSAMQMPFPVGDGVSLEGLAIGDKVAFEFVVETEVWNFYVTKIEKLDAATELEVP